MLVIEIVALQCMLQQILPLVPIFQNFWSTMEDALSVSFKKRRTTFAQNLFDQGYIQHSRFQ